MSEFPYEFQANFKFGPQYKEALVNVPANNPEELLQKLEWLTENAAKFVAAQAALLAVPPALAANVTQTQVVQEPAPQQGYQQPPQQAPAQTGWGQPQQEAPPSFAQQGSGQPGAVETVTDKWNNTWEYGRVDAPATPRGPAVAKHGISQQGKKYSRWEDPAAGPKWFSERRPKVEPQDRWQGSFINNR